MNDWTKELRSISDFCDESTVVPDASNKICKRKFMRSIHEFDHSDEDDNNQPTNSEEPVEKLEFPKYTGGRGYLIKKGYSTKMVGSRSPGLDFHNDTTKAIRSVSNIDYSNDVLENTFKGQNKKVLNGQFSDCVESVTLVDETNEETPPRPLSELLKDCRKPNKQAKLNKLPSSRSSEDESAMHENSKVEINFNNVLKEDDLLDLQSPIDFPSLS